MVIKQRKNINFSTSLSATQGAVVFQDSIFEEPRTRNATKMHSYRQFCYMSIVFGGPPEILSMKSWLYYFFQHTILHLDLLM